MSDPLWLVVGLGNPGQEYARTRHNLGRMAIAELAERYGAHLSAHKAGALAAQVRLGGPGSPRRAVIATPTSYMNESGGPVKALALYYGVDPDRIVILHDDIDIPFGHIRLKIGGGDAGHNGLRSITSALRTPKYYRVRIGAGRPAGHKTAAGYVLAPMRGEQAEELPLVLADAADAVEMLSEKGLTLTQTKYHAR